MNRRRFFTALTAAPAVSLLKPTAAAAALPAAKVTRVRIYRPPTLNPLFNQSNMVVTVETDAGITGIGEGGTKDTLEQCAGTLIGKNPFRIEALWQEVYIAWFYPPGREKAHALGALDLALVGHQGQGARPAGPRAARRQRARLLRVLRHRRRHAAGDGGRQAEPEGSRAATMEAGYRAFRMGAADLPVGGIYDTRAIVRQVAQDCRRCARASARTATGASTSTSASISTTRCALCRAIEQFDPFFVEDPVRDENALQDIPKLRQMTTVPLTHGEEWGLQWDFNRLVENHDVDFIRSTLPNVGGITEMMKVAAICETHAVGIVPHFTGPIATAALVNCLSTFPGPVLMEYNYGGRPIDYLPECLDFKNGKAYTNQRPGPRRHAGHEAPDADRRGHRAGRRTSTSGRTDPDALVGRRVSPRRARGSGRGAGGAPPPWR